MSFYYDDKDDTFISFPIQVSVIWPDQHSSEFNPNWLKKRCFSPEARQATQEELFLNGMCCSVRPT